VAAPPRPLWTVTTVLISPRFRSLTETIIGLTVTQCQCLTVVPESRFEPFKLPALLLVLRLGPGRKKMMLGPFVPGLAAAGAAGPARRSEARAHATRLSLEPDRVWARWCSNLATRPALAHLGRREFQVSRVINHEF
jgi:hypothetical protein